MNNYQGKVAIVTGASSGIGRALAQQLAAAGARLAISGRNMVELEKTAKLCGNAEVRCYKVDVSSREAVFQHAEDVKRDFGSAHYLFNNAGLTVVGTVEHTSIEEYEMQLAVNLWGVIYATKAFLPLMLKQKEGTIVNISSVFGLVGFPAQGGYNMAKFAIRGLTECLWQELDGTGVQAISVHPGGIKTNLDNAGLRVKAAAEAEAFFSELSEKMLVTSPEDCAADILRGVAQNKRRILTGYKSSTLSWLSRLLPDSYPSLLKAFVR